MTVTILANCTINDLDNFTTTAAKAQVAAKNAPGCISYDWYVNGNQCIVYECYENDAAVLAHLEAVGGVLGTLMEYGTLDSINLLGNAGNDVITALSNFPLVQFTDLTATITV